jgi:tetratricopeptide (TPR) repeat protein
MTDGAELDWRDPVEYAERLDGILDALEQHLDGGHADEVIWLAEHLLEADESGAASQATADLHLEACRQARPDPLGLAEALFAFERFDIAIPLYADLLGDAGRARYAELADAAWAEAHGKPSWRLTRIMERLADGDVDRLVAIKASQLQNGERYLEIARLLKDADRTSEALEWAERGVAARPDSSLRDFLADAYIDCGRLQDALSQRAAEFHERPSLAAYRALHAAAEPLACWPERRTAALARLKRPYGFPPNHSPRCALRRTPTACSNCGSTGTPTRAASCSSCFARRASSRRTPSCSRGARSRGRRRRRRAATSRRRWSTRSRPARSIPARQAG